MGLPRGRLAGGLMGIGESLPFLERPIVRPGLGYKLTPVKTALRRPFDCLPFSPLPSAI